jgi:serine/arginine repetitive matrix protein 2
VTGNRKQSIASYDASMANIDTETSGLSELTRREDTGAAESEGAVWIQRRPRPFHSMLLRQPLIPTKMLLLDHQLHLGIRRTTTRPTIVTAVASGSSSSTGLSAPHAKKFSAVNINKKFLQKNSSSPISASPISSSSPSNQIWHSCTYVIFVHR